MQCAPPPLQVVSNLRAVAAIGGAIAAGGCAAVLVLALLFGGAPRGEG